MLLLVLRTVSIAFSGIVVKSEVLVMLAQILD
jgi:hypothetical protein